jgi:hypothetical protein
VLEALIPFTDRQLEYVNRQLQNSYMIDYTLQSINLLIESENDDTADKSDEMQHVSEGEEGPAEAPSALGKRKKDDNTAVVAAATKQDKADDETQPLKKKVRGSGKQQQQQGKSAAVVSSNP